MEYNIDIDKLREDMEDNYGSAMVDGFPMAEMELSMVEDMSDQELVEFARENGVDLRKYIL